MSAAPRRRRNWRRIVVRLVIVLVGLRLLLALLLTWLIDLGAGAAGLDATIGESSLSLLGGHLQLQSVELRPHGAPTSAGAPADAITLGGVDVDLDMEALLGGTVRLVNVSVDDASIALSRSADGRWPLLDALSGGPSAPARPEPATGAPPDFRPPLEIDHLALQPIHLRVEDATASPPRVTLLEGSLRLTGLRGDGREARLEMRLDGRDTLDLLRVDGTLAAQREKAHGTLRLDLAGLRPHGLSALLAAAGLRAAAARIDAGFDLSVDARVESGQAQVALELQQLRVLADGTEALALDALSVGPQAVQAHGLRAALAARADGALGVAGLDLLPGPPGAPPAPPESAAASSASDAPLPSLELTDAHLAWRDERRGPQAVLAVDLQKLSYDASAATHEPNLQLGLSIPGVVQQVALGGRVEATGSHPSARMQLIVLGVSGTALDPFLASAGWATDFERGGLLASLDVVTDRDAAGVLRGRANLRDVVLTDGDRSLAQLRGVTLEGLELDPATSGLHIGTLAIDGPVVGAERDVQGVLRVAGLRSVPPVPLVAAPLAELVVASAPPDVPPAAPPAPPSPAPLIVLDNVRWRGAEISVNDVSVQPPVKLRLRPELDGAGLHLGGEPPAGEAVLRVGAEGVWETCSVRLALRGGDAPGDVRATLALDASDVQAVALRGWLAAAGISTRGLHASLGATLEVTAGAASTDLHVADLMWQEGQQTVLSVPEIRARGLRAEGGGTRLDALEVPGLDLHVARAADGALDFGNLSILPAVPAPASASAVAAPAAESPAPAAPPSAQLALGALRFGADGARLHWRDKSVSPAAEVELSLRASLDGLVLGAPAPPASVQVQLSAPGVCESLDWSGTLSLAPDAQEADGALDVRGVRLDALAGYLPPGCRGALHDGRLALRARWQSAAGEQGGRRAALQVSDVAFRDGEGGEPLLALQSLALDASRLDPDAGVAVVENVAVQGLAVHAERRPDGALAVMGLEFAPVPAEAASAAAAASAPPAARPAGRLASLPLRDLRVDHVDVELRRLELTDASGAGGVPLVVAARLSNPEPLVLLDRSVDDLAPCKLELRASALPIARTLEADVLLDASASRPGLELDLRAEGLRGAGLTEVLPELAARVDGKGLEDGSFHAHLGAELSWPRRGPLDLDMSGGLSGDVELTDVAFRAQPEGEVLLGCERLDVELADVRPATGAARLSSVELTGLRARLGITQDGLAALGLLVRAPPEPPPGEAPVPPPPQPAPPGPEVRIDLFSVSGLDFVVRDELCTPPMVLPLTDLELEVRGWSNWAHVAPRPIRFTGSLRGGLVPLPWRERKGVVLPAGSQPAADGALQERPVFDEFALQGRVTEFPEMTGWANASLAALELPAFAGPARGAGVTLDDGLLDLATHVRYARGEDPKMTATFTFTSLSLSESSGGPIASFLKLPAPLDTVVFLLRNNEGVVSIPLEFDLPPEGFGGGRVLSAAAGAMASVIGRAVASSPLRLAGTVTDFVGVTSSGESEPVEPPTVLDFAPGDPAPPPGTRTAMAQLAERLLDDDDLALVLEHHFSAGDAQRALELGNPSPEDATLVAERLRLERAELLRRRDEAAAEARALLAVGRQAEAEAAAARLRDADRALGAREDSLDRVLGLLDKGAARRAPQRARGAGVEFGEARLREVRAMLVAAGGPELLERVELRPVRFVPDEEPGGGRVTLTLKARPHSGGLLDWMFGWIPKLFASSPPAPEEGS